MGVGIGDYNLDGHLDLFKTHFADDTNGLYHNDGKGNFDDVTRVAGRRRDALRLLGRRDRGPRQRRQSRSVHRHRQRLSGSGAQAPAISQQDAARAVPQSWQRDVRGTDGAGGAGRRGRRTAAGDAPSGISTTMATWTFSIVNLNEPPSLLRNDVTGNRTGSRSSWRASSRTAARSARESWSATAGKVQAQAVAQPVELLFLQRSPAALRSGCICSGGCGRVLAQWSTRTTQEGFCQSADNRAGGLWEWCPAAGPSRSRGSRES